MPLAANLAYEDHGGGGDLPPIVFLHGAGGTRLHWPPRLRRLTGWRTFAVDLPGHGQSPDSGARTVSDHVESLEAWRRAMGIERAILAGHSMGSAIALTAALDAPVSAAGLALIGSGPRLRVNPALLEGLADPDRWTETVGQIIAWSFAPQADPRTVELARRRMLETNRDVLLRDFQACAAFDVASRLAEIEAPTLVLYGAGDRMTPPALGESLVSGIPGAQMRVIDGAGHMLMLEQPAAVEAEIRQFLLQARPAAAS
ncbi:MAG TPA: alpha/beta fold hydrolase [Anaerolineales bacterium]|nr:alpha/beta fold hydrolase [Anaerolineales bacterium]